MKHASKSEVVQVAHTLLDPLLENVHQDVANVRAELVAEGQAREKQDRIFQNLTREFEHRVQILRAELQAFRRQEVLWKKEVEEARQLRAQIFAALNEVQVTQAGHRSDLNRLSRSLQMVLKRIAEDQ